MILSDLVGEGECLVLPASVTLQRFDDDPEHLLDVEDCPIRICRNSELGMYLYTSIYI